MLALGLGLPLVIAAGVGVGVYHVFFRVPEFRAILFDGGRVARGAVLPLADGAVVLSQENAQPALEAIRSGRRDTGEARVYLTRIGVLPADKPRWDVTLDVTGPDTGQVRLWRDGDRVLLAFRDRLEARLLGTGAPLWTATLSDAIHAACRQCFAAGGGRVAVLAADGVVQAFDGATGRPLWKSPTRLNRPITPDLEIAGDLVGVGRPRGEPVGRGGPPDARGVRADGAAHPSGVRPAWVGGGCDAGRARGRPRGPRRRTLELRLLLRGVGSPARRPCLAGAAPASRGPDR